MSRFNYNWKLEDGYPAKGIEKHNRKVFSTFACGGGSSMGYKLAGYNVIGANDIDPQMEKVYKANHNPKYFILGSISDLKTIDLPEELFDLDILDGSPPCSTFSIAGSREKVWKKKKKFREGQSEQKLSDLFFEFIDVAKRLRPRIIVAENVKGMLVGNAKLYVKEIVERLKAIDYDPQVFLLDSSYMGVPQKRQRVFIIARRMDLDLPRLELKFNEDRIPFGDIEQDDDPTSKKLSQTEQEIWDNRKYGESGLAKTLIRQGKKGNWFTTSYVYRNKVLSTIIASNNSILFHSPRKLNNTELKLGSSFPLDYDFMDIDVRYLVGISVPPIMMANVAYEIYNQLLKGITND